MTKRELHGHKTQAAQVTLSGWEPTSLSEMTFANYAAWRDQGSVSADHERSDTQPGDRGVSKNL